MAKADALTKPEITKLQAYLRKTFGTPRLEVRARQKAADAAEVYLGGEFLAVVSKDIDEGEVCYQLNMTILELDLDEA